MNKENWFFNSKNKGFNEVIEQINNLYEKKEKKEMIK